MKKVILTALVVLALGLVATATVPICVLGGPTAMDTHRQLGEGEYFVQTSHPLVVNLQFKPTKEHPEQVGECTLPTGKKVAAKNGILQWVAECGNDEVNKNIPVGPQPLIVGQKGDPGPRGLPGRDGVDGRNGRDGRDGRDGRVVYNDNGWRRDWDRPVTSAPVKTVGKGHKALWITLAIVGGAAAAGIMLGARGNNNPPPPPPQVTTLPPTGGLPIVTTEPPH